jgi:thiol-disulfide isomerase/thioredoxin
MKRNVFFSIVMAMSATGCLLAGELAIGASAPRFALVDATTGNAVALEPGDGKVSVVIFICNQCPFAKAFEPRIIELARQYQPKGVRFYAIDSNDEAKFPIESLAEMKARATEKNYPYPYLKDGDGETAKGYGARVTPHVYVIDGAGKLRYRGYVDDSAKPEERRTTGLASALDDLLAGRPVSTETTRAFGCTIKLRS